MDQEEDSGDATRNDWELCKENVQPLKKGRILSNLTTGLHQHSGTEMTKLREQKQSFEYQLRTYDGDDPLSVWYSYIRWIQQNFPSGGPETGLQTILESSIVKFKDVEKYKNDERFVDIWLNLVIFQTEPLDIFSFMMNKGIGVGVAAYYSAWADEYETVGNFQKAESIYQTGLARMAYPVQNLRSRYADFQQRAMKAAGLEEADEPVVPQRQSLVSIKGQGKHKIAGTERQPVKMVKHVKVPLAMSNDQKFTIFTDGGAGGSGAAEAKSEWTYVPKQGKLQAENVSDPAKWTKSKISTKKAAVSAVPITDVSRLQNPNFSVHVDQNVPDTPSGKSLNIGVFSERKAEKPVTANDIINRVSDSPGKKAMYQKSKVYGGTVEFSFEEIRSRGYFERKRSLQEMESVIKKQLQQQNDYSTKQIKELQEQVQRLSVQLLHQTQPRQMMQQPMTEATGEVQQPLVSVKSKPARNLGFQSSSVQQPRPEQPRLQEPPRVVLRPESSRNLGFESESQKPLVKTPNVSVIADDSKLELPGNSSSFKSSDFTPNNSVGPNCSSDRTPASLTMNTKEAMHVIQGMFNHTLKVDDLGFGLGFDDDESGIQEDSRFAMKSGVQSHTNFLEGKGDFLEGKGDFLVFADADVKAEGGEAEGFQIYSDPAEPKQTNISTGAGFQIFTDGDEGKKTSGAGGAVGAGCAGGAFQIHEEPSKGFRIHSDSENTQPRQLVNPGTDLGVAPFDEDMTFAPGLGSTRKFPGIPREQLDDEMTFNPCYASTRVFQPVTATFCDTDCDKSSSQQVVRPVTETTERFAMTNNAWNLSTIAEGSDEKSSGHHESTNHFCGHTIPASHLETNKTGHVTTSSGFPDVKAIMVNDQELDIDIGLGPTPKKEFKEFKEPMKPTESFRHENSVREKLETSVRELSIAGSLNESLASTSSLESNRHHVIDTTHYTPSPQADDLLSQTIAVDPGLNPFADDVIEDLLSGLEVPISDFPGYTPLQDPVPNFPDKGIDAVILGDEIYHIESKIGSGAFANVYLASKLNDEDYDDVSGTEDKRAIKVQKPACPWEFYIISVLHSRLREQLMDVDVRPGVMSVDKALFYSDGSCLINAFHQRGSLLNLVNDQKTASGRLSEVLVAYIVVELLYIAEALFKCGLIHGDIKPDNVLFIGPPNLQTGSTMAKVMGQRTQSIKLVDFGRGIDLKLLPEGTTFTAKVDTSGFQCIEMQTDKPWTHQTDLFGIVGTIHVLIFNQYMNVYSARGRWRTTGKIPRRWTEPMWSTFFDTMLNVENCDSIPNMADVRKPFETYLLSKITTKGSSTSLLGLFK